MRVKKGIVGYYLNYNSNYNSTFIIHIINDIVIKGNQNLPLKNHCCDEPWQTLDVTISP